MQPKLISFALLASACAPAAIAQDKPNYVMHSCVKAAPGQMTALSALLPDMSKIQQVRADEGGIAFFTALRAAIPAGSSARCDYIFVSGYEGYPPEPLTRAQAEANFRKSGVGGSYDEYIARRDRLMSLVSNDLLRVVANGNVGGGSSVGGYIRLNLSKTKPGHTIAEWGKLETAGWGAYVAAVAKERPGFGWRAEGVVVPTGSAMPYNAITVDILPNWAATGGGWGGTQVWNKVHPDMPSADYLAKVADMVDRYKVELYRVATVVAKK
jgi:hypothetical protein